MSGCDVTTTSLTCCLCHILLEDSDNEATSQHTLCPGCVKNVIQTQTGTVTPCSCCVDDKLTTDREDVVIVTDHSLSKTFPIKRQTPTSYATPGTFPEQDRVSRCPSSDPSRGDEMCTRVVTSLDTNDVSMSTVKDCRAVNDTTMSTTDQGVRSNVSENSPVCVKGDETSGDKTDNTSLKIPGCNTSNITDDCNSENANQTVTLGCSGVDTDTNTATVNDHKHKSDTSTLDGGCKVSDTDGGSSLVQDTAPANEAAMEDKDQREDTERLEAARCVFHPDKNCELFCIQCDLVLCMQCKLADHLHHQSQSLSEAATRGTSRLARDRTWVNRALEDLEKNQQHRKKDQAELKLKKNNVEKFILHRYSLLVAAADQFKTEALKTLDARCSEAEAFQTDELAVVENTLEHFRSLDLRINQADKADDSVIVTVASELTTKKRESLAKELATVQQLTSVTRPVHRSSIHGYNTALQGMKDYIGSVEMLHLKPLQEFTVVEQFRCEGVDDDTTIFCVCPKSDNTVWVSFNLDRFQNKASPRKFSDTGKFLCTLKSMKSGSVPVGRISLKEIPGKEKVVFCTDDTDCPSVYSKALSKNLHKLEHFRGKTYLGVTHILFDQPALPMGQTDQFSIHCSRHRAFDADQSETLFAVVAETREHDVSDVTLTVKRDVKLYRRHQHKVMDTYVSPIASFQPADVCFYVMHGQQVLLIADEHNDVIHVAHVQQDRVTFSCFLTAGCPAILTPTALNVDRQGRVWVGCRGGRVVTLRPTT